MIDKRYIDMVLDRVDIADVASRYTGGPLTRRSGRMWACCPFHQENTPSFCIQPDKGTWHCFGSCGEGGNVIGLVMKAEGLPFPLAVKKLLKEELNMDLPDKATQRSREEEEADKLRETMYIYNEHLCRWFEEQIQADTPDAKAAKGYMLSRWNEDYCREMRIGYAPDSWEALAVWAKKHSLEAGTLERMGVLRRSEKTGNLYSFYRNRLMIPIRDRYSRIEGWTARTLSDKEDRKYLNSSDSDIYHKQESVFGLDGAARMARQKEKFYLVEGGPDVMKLQSLGILNTIASLGGAWTEQQFEQLRRFNATLCFIPDSDNDKADPPGVKNVIKNGSLAMRQGFTVSVREIPNETKTKMDPDSYVTDVFKFREMQEEEFLVWYCRKRWNADATTEERLAFENTLCDLLACVQDENTQEAYLAKLSSMYGHKTEWTQALKGAKRRRIEAQTRNAKSGDIDMLRQFGFTERCHCYYGVTKDGKEVQWSNFTLKPLFHIKDDIRPVRLFEINNDDREQRKEIIELDMEVFTSAKNLRKKLLGLGNYTWLTGEEQLIQMQRYLAKVTETATEVKQLGWQRAGFFCFSNGAQEDGQWHDVDEMGIVRLKAGKFYLPAMSKIYRDSQELFTNERKFRHQTYSNIPLRDYFTKISQVFGDNGRVGLMFYVATLFRDIVKARARFFPILNIFGPKGSGKTELAETLMTFFMADNEPPSIGTDTLPSLSDLVASVSNSLVHIDEYKNGIDVKKIEWLKNLWGSIGRSRMNMDKDKKREQASVNSGIVLTGQEMPTADIALFTRLIYLTYDRQHHTKAEREAFTDLMKERLRGATHITLELLRHRDAFEAGFGQAWKKARLDVEHELAGREIMDRIEGNWLVPLAAYLAIEHVADLPFSYDELLKICIDGMIRQDEMSTRTDEVSNFWNIISSAQQKGIFLFGQDYTIKTRDQLRTNKSRDPLFWEEPRRILMIRKNIMMATYRQLGRQMDERLLPTESMLHYLQISPEYLGATTTPERFRKFGANGQPLQEAVMDGDTVKAWRTVYNQDRPLCFDYQQLSDKYGIILDSVVGEGETHDAFSDTKKQELQQKEEQDLPF